jgi:reticulon-4-interacting protein 1, mitochondrial
MTISGTAVLCLGPDGSGEFRLKEFSRQKPAPDEIEVAVAAAVVNPIDVRRAQGYGRKLLSAIGAGKFPLVLGNDFAGRVTSVGSKVTTFNIGDRVYGAKPPSAEGTHASHVLVKAIHALRAAHDRDLESLAALPYSFVTMWLAVRGAGLTRENAARKKVLVHGAAGGLGTLATRMLFAWGASVTAIARPSSFDTCRQAGAAELVDCTATPVRSLSRSFDATLNFATWDDDLALIGCLRDGGLGHATTVHPLLNNIDRLGWLRGVLKSISEKRRRRRALPKGVRNYAWTIFKPDPAALASLDEFVEQNHASLRIGLRKPLTEAAEAFDHTREGKPGRAVLLP